MYGWIAASGGTSVAGLLDDLLTQVGDGSHGHAILKGHAECGFPQKMDSAYCTIHFVVHY